MRLAGATFQAPPSELLVPAEPELPAFVDAQPMPQQLFIETVAEDAHVYKGVADRLAKLQAWVASELARIAKEDER